MAFATITLDTLSCGPKKYIEVDNQITTVLAAGDKIKFYNELNGNADATVAFFKLDGKGGSKIGGFCSEMEGDTLPVEKTGQQGDYTECTTTLDGQYAYEVTAAPSHEPLDPVIIIDPSVETMSVKAHPDPGQFSAIDVLAMTAALFVGMFIGSFINNKRL
jgi:hypothetical protein